MKNVVTKEELKEHLMWIFYSSSIQVKTWYCFQKDDWTSWLWIEYRMKSEKNTYETMLPISNIWNQKVVIRLDRWQDIFEDMEKACENTVDKIIKHIFNS